MGESGDMAPGGAPVIVVPEPRIRELPLEFRGSGAEYFRIWIVNLLLSMVTLGIYSAWAKVRRLRYFHGSTWLDGSAFGYHASPVSILKGRLIAAALFLAYAFGERVSPLLSVAAALVFLTLLPWIVVRSRAFQLANTSYRNLRFGFDRCYRQMAWLYYGGGLLVAVTLGIALPWWMARRYTILVGNSRFGASRFEAGFHTGQFYRIYTKISLVALLAVTVVVLVMVAIVATGAGSSAAEPDPVVVMRMVVAAYVVVLPAMLFVSAWAQTMVMNAVYNGTCIGHVQLRSALRVWPLYRLYLGNLVAIVLTLGMFVPWARVRLARYRASTLTVLAHGSLDNFFAGQGDAGSALGGEIGDFFDVDLGF